jgi:hypothetical protein
LKKHLVPVVALLAAIGCLHAPAQSAAQSVTPAAKADAQSTASPAQPAAPQDTVEQPMYPIPRTLFAEAIAKYSVGSGHRAMYANITGDQMWSIAVSKIGHPNAQSAISEAKRLCEEHAIANKLDPGKCTPVAINDRQVYDPGPLFSVAERIQAQRVIQAVQRSTRATEDAHQE